MISGLDHVTINTGNLTTTERFYIEVIGLEHAPRPDFGIPGAWLRAKGDHMPPIVHILEFEGRENAGTKGRSTLDHVAFHTSDFEIARRRIEEAGLPWVGNVIPDFGLWQIMLYDPNGVLIELNFKAEDETCEIPVIPQENNFTLENFFSPPIYKAWAAGS